MMTGNLHVPAGVSDSLYPNYEGNLIASYINGEVTNLANTTVYHPFDRDGHWTDEVVGDEDRVFISVDFNVGACFCEVIVRRGDEFHVVDEFYPKDTPAVVNEIQER